MKYIIRLIYNIAYWLQEKHQLYCFHGKYRYVADAWDYEYICTKCDRVWFNSKPSDCENIIITNQ